MSGKLSFRERLEQRENTGDKGQTPSGSPVSVVLRIVGAVDHPVTLIQTLARWGLGLRKAHEIVTRLVEGQSPPALLPNAPQPAEVASVLAELGVRASFPHPPTAVEDALALKPTNCDALSGPVLTQSL